MKVAHATGFAVLSNQLADDLTTLAFTCHLPLSMLLLNRSLQEIEI
jgi:hypothetical protein